MSRKLTKRQPTGSSDFVRIPVSSSEGTRICIQKNFLPVKPDSSSRVIRSGSGQPYIPKLLKFHMGSITFSRVCLLQAGTKIIHVDNQIKHIDNILYVMVVLPQKKQPFL